MAQALRARVIMAMSTATLRVAALGAATILAVTALGLLLGGWPTGPLDLMQALLGAVATFWLGLGAALGVLGLLSRDERTWDAPREAPFTGRAAVLVPICNEDAAATFARILAMDVELSLTGLRPQVDIAILSDTRAEAVAAEEWRCFQRLLAETGGEGRIFYRRRSSPKGRKAGNIEEFVRRYGAAYEMAVILDADSLMTGDTIARMLGRMAAEPRLALLQSAPAIVGARSRFGRMIAFGSAFHGPVFARGLARLQGRTGPFWGHNAVVRLRAFAECCGLPELSGPPPFGGPVLSHDYVEAALLARGGWTVRLDPDLDGSYEEGPEDILAFARRDRRWCQGNLQHARILAAPGLRPWSRFVFVQGIFAYIAPVLWLGFVLVSLAGETEADGASSGLDGTAPLAILVLALLVLPKAMVLLSAGTRARSFGGHLLLFSSTLAEVVQSSLIAPVLLMFQARSVMQVLLGRDGGWPAQARGAASLSWADGWRAAWWITLWGLGLIVGAQAFAAATVPWLLPLAVPMMLAPILVTWTSRPPVSRLFATPDEMARPAVLTRSEEARDRLAHTDPLWSLLAGPFPAEAVEPEPALESDLRPLLVHHA